MTDLFLNDDEVDAICAGLTTNAAKIRHLRILGIVVNKKPNGRALVIRSHAEAVLSGRAQLGPASEQPPTPFKPDRVAYIQRFAQKAT